MGRTTGQLTFDLPHLTARGADDFMVGLTNQAASALVEQWPEWPGPGVALQGPAGVGKSHLCCIWAERSQAIIVAARDVNGASIAQLLDAPAVAVEDLDRGIGDEQALFHLLNHAKGQRTYVLATLRTEPGEIVVTLPDLRSRLRALPVVRIERPDDGLLHVLMVKLFADRQLNVDPSVIKYLSTHMDRSAEAAAAAVGEIDRIALATHKKVTPALAGQALRNLSHAKIA